MPARDCKCADGLASYGDGKHQRRGQHSQHSGGAGHLVGEGVLAKGHVTTPAAAAAFCLQVADFLNGRWTWADARKLMMGEEEGRIGYRNTSSNSRHGPGGGGGGRHGADPSSSPYDNFYGGGAAPSSSSRQLAGGPGGQGLAPGSLGSPVGSFGGGLDGGQRSRSGHYGAGYGGGGYGQPPDPMRLAQVGWCKDTQRSATCGQAAGANGKPICGQRHQGCAGTGAKVCT